MSDEFSDLADKFGLGDKLDTVIQRGKEINARLDEIEGRRPSKAQLIGTLGGLNLDPDSDHFFTSVWKARSRDYDEQREGKEALEAIGSRFAKADPNVKATLGTTDATGGYLMPRALVADLVEQAGTNNPMRRILSVVTGVSAAAVDIPQQPLSDPRATIVTWGSTKPNADLTVASYTATLYTLARVLDVSNQLLRHSAGAAEQYVRNSLARSFALGESYYLISGSGSGEPKGLNTSIAAAPAAFTSSHTAADNTVAGSVRRAVATMVEALAGRNVEPTAVLMNSGDAAHALSQGADAAGFWVDENGGNRILGLPVVTTTALPSKTAIVGDFKSATLFVGDEYRVDVSSEAGDRWDKNLTGFRAEEEIGFNADPPVLAGFFQRVTTLIP